MNFAEVETNHESYLEQADKIMNHWYISMPDREQQNGGTAVIEVKAPS
jgi:hypothetical protein